MKREQYEKIRIWFLHSPKRMALLRAAYRGLPLSVAISYPLCLLLYFFNRRELFLRAVFVPAAIFLFISLFRHLLNFPRPYEKEEIAPLIAKQKKGHSFPSRHAASAGIVAAVWMAYMRPMGAIMIIAALFIALSRVLAGVHYMRDVLVGGVFGFMATWIFFI